MLEIMLGFTLNSNNVQTNNYIELGKAINECSCPNVDTQSLLPADEIVGAYRIYNYNKKDKFYHIDPAANIYTVKLICMKQSEGDPEPSGVTMKTFDINAIRLHTNNHGFINYIERCTNCLCECDCVQLAVDADWLWEDDDMPLDLKYLWVDMINFYSDTKNNIKSESIDSHSYTKGDTKAPETEAHNIAILKKYAGPKGSVTVQPV